MLYKQRHDSEQILSVIREIFPRLDALEDLIADSGSAFRVMSNIDRRDCAIDCPENRLYAMICAISQSPQDLFLGLGSKPTIPDLGLYM